MQPIDPDTRFNIKEQLPEGRIILILKILLKLFRLKNELVLDQVNDEDKRSITDYNIKQGLVQSSGGDLFICKLSKIVSRES